MKKKKNVLTLFLTQDMSLKKWEHLGLLDREMALYKELMNDFHIQIFSYGDVGDLAYEKRYADLKVLIIPYYKKNKTLKNSYHLLKAEFALKKSDVLKTNQIYGSQIAVYYSKKYSIPLITRCGYLLSVFTQSQTIDEIQIQEAKRIEREAFNQATVGITSSERDRKYVIEHYSVNPNKVKTVQNYVDQQVFKLYKGKRKDGHVLFIGRLTNQKNVVELLKAFEKSVYAKILTIIGAGEHENNLIETAKRINKEIRFIRPVPNNELPKYLNVASAYVLPSLYEGLPKTLLEAMSTGIPCIGTDVIGIKEVIEHKKDGILCDTNWESIAKSMDMILSDKQLSLEIGLNAHKKIQRLYSLNQIVEQEKAIYHDIINNE